MSRHGANADRITVAQLDGTATRHAREPERDEQLAVDELVAIATEHRRGVGPRLRVDLLNQAAGTLLGGYRFDDRAYWSAEAAARLLVAAGANRDAVEQIAAATTRHLGLVNGRPSIGNPFPGPAGAPGHS